MISRFTGWMVDSISEYRDGKREARAIAAAANMNDGGSSPPASDVLDRFESLLADEGVKVKIMLQQWRGLEEQLIAIDIPHPENDHVKVCELEMASRKSILKAFFEKVKACFQSAKSELTDEVRRELNGHIGKLVTHINELCARANDPELSRDERIGVLIHLCNASIVVLEELDKLLGDFSNEIGYCLRAEARDESVTQLVINAALYFVQTMTGILLPPVNIDCKQPYREFLNEEIEQPKEQLIMGVTGAEGALARAEKSAGQALDDLRVSGISMFHGDLVATANVPEDEQRIKFVMH